MLCVEMAKSAAEAQAEASELTSQHAWPPSPPATPDIPPAPSPSPPSLRQTLFGHLSDILRTFLVWSVLRWPLHQWPARAQATWGGQWSQCKQLRAGEYVLSSFKHIGCKALLEARCF